MIKVLAIGNSFSQDATQHLHDVAEAGGVHMLVGNLYIGGCSLETHWKNASTDAREYEFYVNGKLEKKSSIKEAFDYAGWDYVTFQQVSHLSGVPETYLPYLDYLSGYVKSIAPKARQLLHQTWAYETDSKHEGFIFYKNDQKYMFEKLKDAYNYHAARMGLKIIPCGEAMQIARSTSPFDYGNGGRSLCRDGFHASLSLGRYLLSAVWYEVLTGRSILDNPYVPGTVDTDLSPSHTELEALKFSAHKAVSLYK